MQAQGFPQSNRQLLPPDGLENEVLPLPVWTDGQRCISRWRPTFWERLQILFTGDLWLHVNGPTHPPLVIDTRFPFEE
jgi:hypothetical protein